MSFDPYPEYLTIEQAAAYAGVSTAAIRRLLREHGLNDFLRASIGKQALIKKSDLDALGVTQSASRESQGRRRRGGAA